jgi:hypothetical protein
MKFQTPVSILFYGLLVISTCAERGFSDDDEAARQGLVGWWKLEGDCRDYSARGNHGKNRGVDLRTATCDGRGAHIEVPHHESLALGKADFTICAWVATEKHVTDVLGDVVSKYDPARRRGFNLYLKSSSGGYQSCGDDRQVHFGIDNAKLTPWQDCGRPSATSNYVSNSMTVFRGHLYAAITDAKAEEDWCRVFRYGGDKKWTDCGRIGNGKTTGVMSLIVHQGALYAATTTYDWTRVFSGKYDPVRVYRYDGGTRWADCGQPGPNLRINCMASYRGKLYAGGDRGMLQPGERQWKGRPYRVYEYQGGTKWKVSAEFPAERPKNCYPHAMAVHDGKLYVGYPNVYSFDGQDWKFVGTPVGHTPKELLPMLQVHCLEVFRGQLLAGMWPEARAVAYRGGEDWEDRGRLGEGTEVNALTVYNGKLYGGAIPRAEVTRYDGDRRWTSLHRFYSPKGWTPAPPDSATNEQVNEWTRVTSLTVHQGRLFASIGSCTASVLDAPADVRGKVFSMEAGKCVSYGNDIGPGWQHIAAVRWKDRLAIFVNGKRVAESSPFRGDDFDISNDQPLKIGSGEMDYFSGKIKDVRIYTRALDENEIRAVQHKTGVGGQ